MLLILKFCEFRYTYTHTHTHNFSVLFYYFSKFQLMKHTFFPRRTVAVIYLVRRKGICNSKAWTSVTREWKASLMIPRIPLQTLAGCFVRTEIKRSSFNPPSSHPRRSTIWISFRGPYHGLYIIGANPVFDARRKSFLDSDPVFPRSNSILFLLSSLVSVFILRRGCYCVTS